jgi:hypothetical protein
VVAGAVPSPTVGCPAHPPGPGRGTALRGVRRASRGHRSDSCARACHQRPRRP